MQLTRYRPKPAGFSTDKTDYRTNILTFEAVFPLFSGQKGLKGNILSQGNIYSSQENWQN